MKDYSFCSQDTGKPYYYVFDKHPGLRGHEKSAFYRYDTAKEAAALFQYLQTERPDLNFSLGIHKDYSRRADIIEYVDGATVLSDDFKRTTPWKDDPDVAAVANELSDRLDATWKVDRELVGEPILVPNEPKTSVLPQYFEGKNLCPDVPGEPRTSIQELFVQTLGWMSIEGLKSVAKHPGHGNPGIPMVDHCLIAYRVEKNGFRGTASISLADFKTMEERYLAQLERGALQKDGHDRADFDALKREAKARAQNQPRPITHANKTYDHAL